MMTMTMMNDGEDNDQIVYCLKLYTSLSSGSKMQCTGKVHCILDPSVIITIIIIVMIMRMRIKLSIAGFDISTSPVARG